jgi:pimeloyl-ACP methyl ester carboxylesterase
MMQPAPLFDKTASLRREKKSKVNTIVTAEPPATPISPLRHSSFRVVAQVSVPTLVMHAGDDALVAFDQGRRLAAGIPGARFVPLASRNHLIREDEPAFPRFLEEMKGFLAH